MAKEEKKPLDEANKTPQMEEVLEVVKLQSKQIEELTNKLKSQDDSKTIAEAERLKAEKEKALAHDLDLESLLLGDVDDSDPKSSKKFSKSNIDELSNAEMMGVLADSMEKFLDAKLTKVVEATGKTNSDLSTKIDNTQALLARMVSIQSVNDLRNRYPDFDTHKEAISKLLDEIPGIPIEKAYKFAKAEAIASNPNPLLFESELPGQTPGHSGLNPIAPRSRTETEDALKPIPGTSGVQQFRNILSTGIDKALASRRR